MQPLGLKPETYLLVKKNVKHIGLLNAVLAKTSQVTGTSPKRLMIFASENDNSRIGFREKIFEMIRKLTIIMYVKLKWFYF